MRKGTNSRCFTQGSDKDSFSLTSFLRDWQPTEELLRNQHSKLTEIRQKERGSPRSAWPQSWPGWSRPCRHLSWSSRVSQRRRPGGSGRTALQGRDTSETRSGLPRHLACPWSFPMPSSQKPAAENILPWICITFLFRCTREATFNSKRLPMVPSKPNSSPQMQQLRFFVFFPLTMRRYIATLP